MIETLDHIWLGILAVLNGPELFSVLGLAIPAAPMMLLLGVLTGIAVGATPGLAGPMAMAISLPILISIFGFTPDALLPVFGFLIGIMKGATLGGAVPAILFNLPGTPDAMMTTLDGHPIAQAGEPHRALRIAQMSSVAGDTFSDLVLFICAPFLAIMVEEWLDLPEKTALLILSISCVAAVMGVLIVGEIFVAIDNERRGLSQRRDPAMQRSNHDGLKAGDLRRIRPYIARGAVIGTLVGALPGVGSTLAATLSYSLASRRHRKVAPPSDTPFGKGAPEGIAATEAANSAISGANLIPVLSLGIPGNAVAVFLIPAADSIGGFNPGPAVFRFTSETNPELVVVSGIFFLMVPGNLVNWTLGGSFMRSMGVLARVPVKSLLPVVLLVTLTAICVQEASMFALWTTVGFGVLGYLFRRRDIPVIRDRLYPCGSHRTIRARGLCRLRRVPVVSVIESGCPAVLFSSEHCPSSGTVTQSKKHSRHLRSRLLAGLPANPRAVAATRLGISVI
ncbi:tripartite tricarboxylate transporter permease [Sagittula sp. S175]|uniref:tripartite tricarboxylate transporter permease n=1 Tax=Sagittula sp. S175 TaxID=3415129 RepID=UPI003C7D9D7C